MKRKITVVTGSRADYGILRPLLEVISHSKNLHLFLIVTGMHLSKRYGLTINEIKKDGFRIFATIDMLPKGDSVYHMSKALGKGIMSFSDIFRIIKPDINLVFGDRDEMLASALAAYHMNIPNAHIHGGDKSQGGIDEYNRHAITKVSNFHFAATLKSKKRIIKMGEDPKYVFHTGSPSIDEIIENKITTKEDLEKKYNLKFTGKEMLLIQHPVTTETELTKQQITQVLNAIIKTGNITIAISPNSDAGSKIIFEKLRLYSKKYDFINVYPSLPRRDYLGMLSNCGVLLGNSSSGIIEASYFDIPVINIGIRQKDRESGSKVINIKNISIQSIYSAIEKCLKMKYHKERRFAYGKGHASHRIARYLETLPLDRKLIKKQIFY